MIHFHNVEQGSYEWLELKKCIMSGSNATPIGANGAGLRTYCKKLALEKVLGVQENYTNAIMDRGSELEPFAVTSYELDNGVNAELVGFVTNDLFKGVGVSPDALIEKDGGLEVKARNNAKHFSLLIGEETEIPKNQIQMCLLITERKWWDFISYNPNFDNPIFVKRIYPDLVYHKKLKVGFEVGRKLIEENLKKYRNHGK